MSATEGTIKERLEATIRNLDRGGYGAALQRDALAEIERLERCIARAELRPTLGDGALPERMFPILGGSPKSIPWSVIEPFDGQAKSNHGGQDLKQLAGRGGLDPAEAIAVMTAVSFYKLPKMTNAEATLRLLALVKERQALASPVAGADLTGRIGGYAPGNYTCRCLGCGTEFQGDKRSISCRPCALASRSHAGEPQQDGPA